jgi:8-oxo-dGTP diphosphatase
MIRVTAAIIFKGDNILIAKRSPLKHLAGFWEFPGGKVEEGESEEQCLKREIMEELGIEINVMKFFKENIHEYSDRTILLKAYLCEYINGKLLLKDHDSVEWVEKTQLKDFNFAPADIPFITFLNGEYKI